jgi:hypothetical protein
MDELRQPRTTASEFDALKASMELDLIAAFKNLEEDVQKVIAQGAAEGLTVEQIEKRVDELFT